MNDEQVSTQHFKGEETKVTNNYIWGDWTCAFDEYWAKVCGERNICKQLGGWWHVNGVKDKQQPNEKSVRKHK